MLRNPIFHVMYHVGGPDPLSHLWIRTCIKDPLSASLDYAKSTDVISSDKMSINISDTFFTLYCQEKSI